LTARDAQPLSSATTATFSITITNTAPRLVSAAPPNLAYGHHSSASIDLSSYFVDDDGDPMTMTATFSFNGGAAQPIPGGIFT